MRPLLFTIAMAAFAVSGCEDAPVLTREAFVAALKKCQPINARFIVGSGVGARPTVEFTVPNNSSTIPDCMAKEFGDARPKEIRINYATSRQ